MTDGRRATEGHRGWLPVVGVAVAITVTTAMDAGGLAVFSALPLLPLMGLFWYLERLPRRAMGFVLGKRRHYGLAVLYPIVVVGTATLLALAGGAAEPAAADWRKAAVNLLLVSVSTALVTIVTEEGFFRGWLWASLEARGVTDRRRLAASSVAFALWHVSAVTLDTGFDLPLAQVPVYLLNATLLGAVWGVLRGLSGSVIVASVSHGLWNGLAYVLFGFGRSTGALGVAETGVYGPEVGWVGVVLNAGFLVWLWRRRWT